MENGQSSTYRCVLPEQLYNIQRIKINLEVKMHHHLSTSNASHSFSLLAASRIGGAHLNRVSPSSICSAANAR